MNRKKYQERLLKAIPGGAHTYSRGFDQFPNNAPEILSCGNGAYIHDNKGNKYLDYGMALRAVNIGYSEKIINKAAINQIKLGNNLTRPSNIELEAAELLIELIDSVDMVKFTKNGSTAVSAAVKLARSYTGRDMVARCLQHPFFSYDDWFIGSTSVKRGIPKTIQNLTKTFDFNNIESLEKLLKKYPNKFACVVLEPETDITSKNSNTNENPTETSKFRATKNFLKNNYLRQVQDLCKKYNVVFILDEMITGFRWHLKGAQHLYKLKPDLTTFGKAMANGFSVSCVAGKKEIMQLGSIEKIGQERTFLLSTTHGAEMCGLGAFVATVKFMKKYSVVDHMWEYGYKLKNIINNLAYDFKIDNNFIVSGPSCSPVYKTYDNDKKLSLSLRTLFSQEMINNKILMPYITLCYRHQDKELLKTTKSLKKVFPIIKKGLNTNIESLIKGNIIKPVFRKYN
jgi:glutamate-1-semialdehyde 2,1-aminomutase